jgi:meso-butanediol dehydrogenase/(S,S)-butanediol dehydrogenase/diacetyl reductase
MNGRLRGQVAFITGGESGIGLACAKALTSEGASVLIAGLDPELGGVAAASLNREGQCADFCQTDVRDANQVGVAFHVLDSAFGGLDIVINNAGVNAVGTVDKLTEALWDACLDTNLKGAFLVSREAIPRLRAHGGGTIVNVASSAGVIARPADPAYGASKAGLVMLTKAMALAHSADRIRINAVCPGPVTGTRLMAQSLAEAANPTAAEAALIAASPMAFALGRMITTEEVAALVLYLCLPESRMVTGAVITIDGGKSAGLSS